MHYHFDQTALKNPFELNERYCTFDQVEPMGKGECYMRGPGEKSLNSDYSLLSKREFAGLLGCTTRTVDRMVASEQIPLSVIVRIPNGVKGGFKTRFIYGRTVAWIKSLAGPMKQNAEAN